MGVFGMVGPARFELAAFRPPDGRANQAAPRPDADRIRRDRRSAQGGKDRFFATKKPTRKNMGKLRKNGGLALCPERVAQGIRAIRKRVILQTDPVKNRCDIAEPLKPRPRSA